MYIYYVCSVLSVCFRACQKRVSYVIIDDCQPPSGCWEQNSGPLEEQLIRLTSESFLQPLIVCLLYCGLYLL